MQVSIRQLTKRFGATAVLKSVSLEVADRELFFLLGPSGCGKTTLLRSIAGFYVPDEGELCFGDRRMNDVPPHRRNTGMVFQNYALWPHLTVAENVAYGLEVRSVPASEKRQRVAEALRIVRMEAYGERTPNQLSGGQQQRVALARALVIRPDVLLLDEPLSNLDARLRLEMRDEIRRIHDETRITTIYVTHDQKEALSMADRMAVLREGVVEQIGPPREVYRRPASRFVADFIGEANWLTGVVREAGPAGIALDTPVGRWTADSTGGAVARVGAAVEIGFRPEAVVFETAEVAAAGGAGIRFEAVVERVTYLGEIEQYVLVLADGSRIKAFEQDPEIVRPPGMRVSLRVLPASLFLLPAPGAAPVAAM
jgi:iron(III) transport system ATP-binding protein